MSSLARTLGEFAAGFPAHELPPLALERARMSLASTLASASAGYAIDSTRIVRGVEAAAGGRPEAGVWFDKVRLPADRAARVNAVASDAAASDDSDMRSIAHIGTIVATPELPPSASRVTRLPWSPSASQLIGDVGASPV